MDVFELSATLTLDSQDYDSGLSKAKNETSRFGDVLKANLASQAIQAGIKGVAKGFELIASVTRQAVSSYGQYEQLVGGIETLYKTSADTVLKYADNAYKTAGMSANQYMETATSFAAALTQSLGGDTAKAAEYANIAIMDMSDNANKMGTSIDSIVQTYQSLSRGNYAMLDNLKLGYGGTKAELERLLEDAERYKAAQGEIADYSIDSYSDIVEAIHVVQDEMGITGTTASEAASTIEGSLSSAKAAWENLLSGLANGNADVGALFDTFFSAVATAASNIIPAVQTALSNIVNLIVTKGPELAQQGMNLILQLGQGIAQGIPNVIAKLPDIIVGITNFITSNLPAIIQTGVQIIAAIVKGLAQALPQLIAAAPQIIQAIAQGIAESAKILWDNGPEIVQAIGQGILNALSALGDLGVQIVQAIAEGILRALGFLGDAIIAVFDGGLDAGDTKMAEYRAMGEHAATETSDGYRDNSFSLYDAVVDSLDNANDAGEKEATRGSVTGEILSESTASGVENNAGQISTQVSGAVSSAISAGQSAASGASAIGAAISNGIASGITSAAKRIASAAANVVTSALTAARAAIDVNSPSKLFRDQVGIPIGLGVAKGIELSEDEAVRAADELARNTFSASQEWLRRQTKFNKWSLMDQLEVWREIQSHYIKESEQWMDAEEQIFDLRENIQDNFRDNVEKIWGNIADAYDNYADTLASRTQQIADSYGLFDDVQDRTRLSGGELLMNLQRQVNVMGDFYKELDQLTERGASEEMVQQIREMGPKAIDQLDALLSMTDQQFEKYVNLFGEKQQIANETALKELSGLRSETAEEIMDQLGELNRLYEENSDVLGKTFVTQVASGIEESMGKVVSAAKKLAQEANNAFYNTIDIGGVDRFGSTTFGSSALGAASAQIINTVAQKDMAGGTFNINLNVDGNTVARTTFDPLKNYAASKGQPIVAAT